MITCFYTSDKLLPVVTQGKSLRERWSGSKLAVSLPITMVLLAFVSLLLKRL